MRWIVFLLCFIGNAWAAEVRLAWDANSEPDLAGYKIHYGTASGSYTVHVDVGNVTAYTVPGLADGVRYYFAATAYDNEVPSLESGYSNEVNWISGEPAVHIGATALIASRYQVGEQQMALARTAKLRTNSAESHGTGGFTTASFSVDAGALLVVSCYAIQDSGSTDPSGDLSISDSLGLTWSSRAVIGTATSWSNGLRIWTAPTGSGGSMTITVDCGSRNIYVYQVAIIQFAGHDTSAPTGATATDGNMSVDGADSITLSGAPASDSYVIAVLGFNSDVPDETTFVMHGAGWTEIYDNSIYYTGIQVQERTGSTNTSVAWDDVDAVAYDSHYHVLGAAVEIKASTGGGASAVPVFMRQYKARRQ